LRLTFLGRCDQRWKVRVDWDGPVAVTGLTLGLYDDEGRALGASVVAPAGVGSGFAAALSGPCSLPPGSRVRCVADLADGTALELELPADARQGLEAYVRGEPRVHLVSRAELRALAPAEIAALGAGFPWLAACGSAPGPTPTPAAAPVDDVCAMLRDDFGIDPDDLDPDLVGALKV
jgi:hypothetical protein